MFERASLKKRIHPEKSLSDLQNDQPVFYELDNI
jgi:hypothetical protein